MNAQKTSTDPSIRGTIATKLGAFPMRFRLLDDTITGRVGHALQGHNLDLALRDNGVRGNVGQTSVVLALVGGELVGQLGTEHFVLRGVDRITGSLGDTNLIGQRNKQQLIGKIGTSGFNLELGDCPPWIGTLVATLAHAVLER